MRACLPHAESDFCFLDCRTTGDAQRGGDSREDADGNLKDGFPSFFLHNRFSF